MAIYLLKRLGVSVLLIFLVPLATFLVISLSPGNAAYTILGPYASPSRLAALEESLHLNESLPHQYVSWIGNAFHGNLGDSLLTGQPVTQAISGRIEPTVTLILLSMIVIAVVGTALGITGALRGGVVARVIDAVGLVGVAIPGFIIGLGLVIVFAVKLRLLPSSGYTSLSSGLGSWAKGLVLPVAALAIGSIGLVAKQVRASMVDAMRSEFVRTFTANGFSRRSIVYRHALRSAAVPVLAVMGVTLVGLLGGSVLIEQVFGLPGLGSLAVSSTVQKDLPVVQAVAIVYTLIVVVVNLLLDIAYVIVNPKVNFR